MELLVSGKWVELPKILVCVLHRELLLVRSSRYQRKNCELIGGKSTSILGECFSAKRNISASSQKKITGPPNLVLI
jgi:hypothetical protein